MANEGFIHYRPPFAVRRSAARSRPEHIHGERDRHQTSAAYISTPIDSVVLASGKLLANRAASVLAGENSDTLIEFDSADEHGQGHRFAQGPAEGQQHGADDSGLGRRNNDCQNRFPPGGAQTIGRLAQLRRNADQRIAADRRDRRAGS